MSRSATDKNSGITQERVVEILSYDSDTGIFIWRSASAKQPFLIGRQAGNLAKNGYLRIKIDGREYLAHRLAWFVAHGRWPKEEIDHVNGHKTDNRIGNLREASRQDNARNRKIPSNNTSGLKGVSHRKERGKFEARIVLDGRVHFIGHYNSAEEAHSAYLSYANAHFCGFVREKSWGG